MPDGGSVTASFEARPRRKSPDTYSRRWDAWLLPRVDGQFTGTTDEIFQWGACKWGLSDNMLRAIADRESTWFQYATYPSGRCVIDYGCGDIFAKSSNDSVTYCDALRVAGGHDYESDLGRGICPKTFSIVGVMSWDDPAWQAPAPAWPDNQNGTFPFNRDSTAFAVDYLGSYLRGCLEGWITWLHPSGGDIWGCVGSWYSGDWHSADADRYTRNAKRALTKHIWLDRSWARFTPACDPTFGCPV
jgi:hypothetical protein